VSSGDIKALIIDDDEDVLRTLSAMLKLNGILPYSASSGKEGIKIAKEIKPDVILLDAWLPDMDGLNVGLDLKKTPETASIPIILVTGDETLDNEKGISAVAVERIIKPVDPKQLVSAILKSVNKNLNSAVLPSTDKKKILIVDDDVQICDMLKSALVRKGYDSLTIYDGRDILAFVKKNRPDMIFLDFTFPTGPNGIEICRILKTNPETKRIPVIMMTANEDANSVDKCFEVGAEDYIFKPFTLVDLLLRIKKYQAKRND